MHLSQSPAPSLYSRTSYAGSNAPSVAAASDAGSELSQGEANVDLVADNIDADQVRLDPGA